MESHLVDHINPAAMCHTSTCSGIWMAESTLHMGLTNCPVVIARTKNWEYDEIVELNSLQYNAPAQCILERNSEHDHKSSIMPIKIYTFSYFPPATDKYPLQSQLSNGLSPTPPFAFFAWLYLLVSSIKTSHPSLFVYQNIPMGYRGQHFKWDCCIEKSVRFELDNNFVLTTTKTATTKVWIP